MARPFINTAGASIDQFRPRRGTDPASETAGVPVPPVGPCAAENKWPRGRADEVLRSRIRWILAFAIYYKILGGVVEMLPE